VLKLMAGLPANVVAIEAVGKVEADDYRSVLDPALAAATKGGAKVRLLYLLGGQYEGYSTGAMWEDTKLGMQDFNRFDRIAVVTDHNVMADAIRVFGWLVPGEVRTYTTAQLDDARAWVSEAPAT
jgi:SpoIIAA-like